MTKKAQKKVGLCIDAFDRQTESIAMQLTIEPVDLIELRRLVGLPEDFYTAVGGTDLKPEHLPKIRQWIDAVLNTDRYVVQFEEAALSQSFQD